MREYGIVCMEMYMYELVNGVTFSKIPPNNGAQKARPSGESGFIYGELHRVNASTTNLERTKGKCLASTSSLCYVTSNYTNERSTMFVVVSTYSDHDDELVVRNAVALAFISSFLESICKRNTAMSHSWFEPPSRLAIFRSISTECQTQSDRNC